jgi:hypothetical protein
MNKPTNLTQLYEDILDENYHLDHKRCLSIVIHFLCIEMIIGSFAKEEKKRVSFDRNEPYTYAQWWALPTLTHS